MIQIAPPSSPVLLVGGYGVVGQQVAQALNRYMPSQPIIIAGRNLIHAQTLAASLNNAKALQINVDQPVLPSPIKPALIVGMVNDENNQLLKLAIEEAIPYLDITRWTDRLKGAVAFTQLFASLKSPVVFASSWMASVPASLAIEISRHFEEVDLIDMDILYSISDKSGKNSVDYMDRLTVPFEFTHQGKARMGYPFSDPKRADFKEKSTRTVFRYDTPDQFLLPKITRAKSVSSRIGFNDWISNQTIRFLLNTKIWHFFTKEHYKGFRHLLLHKPGEGGEHKIMLTVTGRDKNQKQATHTLYLNDPAGQTHLTALGTAMLIEEIIRQKELSPKVHYGEMIMNSERLRKRLIEEKVLIEEKN